MFFLTAHFLSAANGRYSASKTNVLFCLQSLSSFLPLFLSFASVETICEIERAVYSNWLLCKLALREEHTHLSTRRQDILS